MERQVNYKVIGLIFLLVLLGMIAFIFYLGRLGFNKDDYNTYAIYTDANISGIGKNTQVKLKGLSIGLVSSVGFNYDTDKSGTTKRIKIIVDIKKEIPLHEHDSFSIASNGLAGLNFLSLSQNINNPVIKDPASDKTLTLNASKFGQILDKVDNMAASLSSTVDSVNKLLSKENIASFHNILANIELLSKSMGETKGMIDNLGAKTTHLVSDIDASLAGINAIMYQGQVSLKALDGLLYKGQGLLERMEENPYNTVFGTREVKKPNLESREKSK